MEWIGMAEAAELMGFSYWKLLRLIYARDNHPPYYYYGKQYKFKRQDVLDWIERHRVTVKQE